MSEAKELEEVNTEFSLRSSIPVEHMSLQLDAPGLFFVEARDRIRRGSKKLELLQHELAKHRRRVTKAQAAVDEGAQESAWVDVIQGVGSLEPTFGRAISEFAMADVLLVTAAEAYINTIAIHVLTSGDAEHFDKLSPVGKWLFLPRIMRLGWQPSLSEAPLQQFATLVARRNRVIHPKVVSVKSAEQVEGFLNALKLDTKSANDGLLAVKGLVLELSLSWRGSYGPDWLDEESAKKHPPCFVSGGPEAAMRLGRRASRRKRDVV